MGRRRGGEAGALRPPRLLRGPAELSVAAVTQLSSSWGPKPTHSDAASSEDQGQNCMGSGTLRGCCLDVACFRSSIITIVVTNSSKNP